MNPLPPLIYKFIFSIRKIRGLELEKTYFVTETVGMFTLRAIINRYDLVTLKFLDFTVN